MAAFRYNGYLFTQEEEENHHYMIWDEDSGKPVLHVSYNGGLFTQAEAEHEIENYIAFRTSRNIEDLIKK